MKCGGVPLQFPTLKVKQQRDYVSMNLLVKEMKENGPDQLLCYRWDHDGKNLCNVRRLGEALEVLKKMRDGEACIEPDIVIYNTLIDGLCKVGRQEEGLKLTEWLSAVGETAKLKVFVRVPGLLGGKSSGCVCVDCSSILCGGGKHEPSVL